MNATLEKMTFLYRDFMLILNIQMEHSPSLITILNLEL